MRPASLLMTSLLIVLLGTTTLAQERPGDLVDQAQKSRSLKTLLTALDAAGLTDTLRTAGPFTLLAPSDKAFAAIPPKVLEGLLAKPKQLGAILKMHVVPGRFRARQISRKASVATLDGRNLTVDISRGPRIGGARVIRSELIASNGVIHIIDRVLLPGKALESPSWNPPSEASLPQGFPEMTPPGVIRVKRYPNFRCAYTEHVGILAVGTWTTFWTLFQHIDGHKIPMTAPVVAIYPKNVEGALWGEMQVGFVYPDVRTGKTGPDQRVQVLDEKPQHYLTLGYLGNYDMGSMRRGLRQLKTWIKANPQWRISGPARRLMYQQPKLRSIGRHYSEIELPIERVPTKPKRDA